MENIFRKGQKATIIAWAGTLFFAVSKAVVGLISGSVVLIADAIHSAADSFSTLLAWFGLRIAQKKPNEKFSYGYYKAESIASFLISALILFAGYEIIRGSISKIASEYQIKIPFIAISVAVLDALIMFIIGSYEVKVGRKINSQSLIADGTESKTHIFSSSIVLAGLVASWLKISYLEGIMGIIISIFIFKIGIVSIRDAVFALMDVSPGKEIEADVKKALDKISGLREYEDLKLRKSGPFIFGQVKAKISKTVNVGKAHQISESIERSVKEKVKQIDSFLVVISPYRVKAYKICVPTEQNLSLNSKISPYFGRAKSFIFAQIKEGKIINYYFKANPYKGEEKRAGLNAALFIIKEKIDILITKEIGPISLHTLRDNIVDVYQGEDGNTSLSENISRFLEGKMKILQEPTVQRI